MSKNKLIINKDQLSLITKLVKENDVSSETFVKSIVEYLDEFYEPTFITIEDNSVGDFKNTPSVLNKVNDEMVDVKSLMRHLKQKFDFTPEFIGQTLRDWFDGKLNPVNGFALSKNETAIKK